MIRRQADAPTTMTTKRHVAIHATPRHDCGIRPGDQLLLVALPHDNVLHIHPLAYLDTLYSNDRPDQ